MEIILSEIYKNKLMFYFNGFFLIELVLSLNGTLGFNRTSFEEQCPRLIEPKISNLFCSLKH